MSKISSNPTPTVLCKECNSIRMTDGMCIRCDIDKSNPEQVTHYIKALHDLWKSYGGCICTVHRKMKELKGLHRSKATDYLESLERLYSGRRELIRIEILYLKSDFNFGQSKNGI